MIRVVIFDSIDGTNPLYCITVGDTVFGMAVPFAKYRFIIQSLYHLRGQAFVNVTMFDANNNENANFSRQVTLRDLVEEFERDEIAVQS
jgi:hypothetical protein